METFPKIQTLFKRHQSGPRKGKMIRGEWTTPELKYLAGNEWEFTEKVDGTNIRIEIVRTAEGLYIDFAGRTDNAVLPGPLLGRLESLFPDWPTKAMPTGRARVVNDWMTDNAIEHVILFGEGYGPKIQNGGNYRADQDFVLFDVKVGDWWLNRDSVNEVARALEIDAVPVIGYGTLQDAIDIVSSGITFNEQGAVVRWGAGTLKSQWGDFNAEGIVARPKVALFDRKGERIICKIKVVDFR